MLNLINEVFLEAGIVTHEEKMKEIKNYDSPLLYHAQTLYRLIDNAKRAIAGDKSVMELYNYQNLEEFKKDCFYVALKEYKTDFLPYYLISKGILNYHPYCINCVDSTQHSFHRLILLPDDYSVVYEGMRKLKEMQKNQLTFSASAVESLQLRN